MNGKGMGYAYAAKECDQSTFSGLQMRIDGAFGLVSLNNGTSNVTFFDIINIFLMVNFLVCRYPKNNWYNHHMQRCTLVKESGLNFTYTPETDIHLEQTKKHHIQKTKKYAKK